MLDAVSENCQTETTATAKSSMTGEKSVQEWINTSPALNFSNLEKTDKPEVTNDPLEHPGHNNGKTVEDQNMKFQGTLFQKNVEAMLTCSNSTLTITFLKFFGCR